MPLKPKRVTMPGIRDDLNNSKAVQSFIKNQIYMMGFPTGVNAGSNPNINIRLSGSARAMYGLIIFVTQALVNEDDTFSLSINQESVITNCPWKAFYPATNIGNNKPQMFFPLPRPLSGSDAVNLSWTAVSQKTVYPTFYLSDNP